MAGIGITHILKTLDDLEAILNDVISITTGGLASRAVGILELASDLNSIVKTLSQTLPELKDIDAQESGALMVRAYDMLSRLIKSRV